MHTQTRMHVGIGDQKKIHLYFSFLQPGSNKRILSEICLSFIYLRYMSHILQTDVFRKYFREKRAEANVKPMKSEVIQFKRDQTNRKPRSITALETVENQKKRKIKIWKLILLLQVPREPVTDNKSHVAFTWAFSVIFFFDIFLLKWFFGIKKYLSTSQSIIALALTLAVAELEDMWTVSYALIYFQQARFNWMEFPSFQFF